MRFPAVLFFFVALSLSTVWASDDPFSLEIYTKNCAQCHDHGAEARIPPRATLEKMSAGAVLRALESGAMREMGDKLTRAERLGVAGLLGKAAPAAIGQIANRCGTSPSSATASAAGFEWTGWGASLNNGRFQNAAEARLSASDVPRLRLKWAFGLPEATTMRS